ncbi:MAG: glycoside hydrolase family 99-like domain-containing protein [Clostridia bacterium]|nr:glycoside hydrolase family 99-like domain-containing protein [Clostridia bacterium]
MKKTYDIAAFIWPSYTGDEPRTRIFWPEGMGEWQSVKSATAKYPGHQWPRRPLWGYVNEADPYVMEMEINAAADHGVNVFIYDWYWYDDRPFLEQCLDNGYLKAKNNDRVKFYLMWANHDAMSLWDKRNAESNSLVWYGKQDEKQFDIICGRLIEKYFTHPSYYKIDGKPVFMIYDVANLIEGLGGIENTRRKLDQFRGKCVAAGLPGLHLQLTQWGDRTVNLSGVDGNAGKYSTQELLEKLGFDSLTNYQYVHFLNVDRDYNEITEDAEKHWKEFGEKYDVPYFPHVSLGWDNNPRFNVFRPGVVKNNTPENVEKALRRVKAYADSANLPVPLITINSWNEWTETSYLEPDDLYGYGYLDAIKKVFVDED